MNRSTWIGRLFRTNPARARVELVNVLERNHANLDNSALDIGIGKRHLIKLIWQHALWDEVDRIRATNPKPKEPEWMARARAALQGHGQCAKTGKS